MRYGLSTYCLSGLGAFKILTMSYWKLKVIPQVQFRKFDFTITYKIVIKSQACKHRLVIPVMWRLRNGLQSEFRVTLGDVVRPCLKMKSTERAEAEVESQGCSRA